MNSVYIIECLESEPYYQCKNTVFASSDFDLAKKVFNSYIESSKNNTKDEFVTYTLYEFQDEKYKTIEEWIKN